MSEKKLKLRGYIYLIISLSIAIPAVIGAAAFTFFFIVGDWTRVEVSAYAGIMILCILSLFLALLLYGSSRTYMSGPSADRDELERIRKETND